MKKFLLFPLFLIVNALYAQDTFVVPVLDCAHKHQFMTGQTNAMMLASINYAKASGKTVEDLASYTGDLFAKTWNKDAGFNGLIKGILHNAVCLTPGGTVEILEQSAELVKIKATGVSPQLKNNGTFLNVTYTEYITYLKIMMSKICSYMGADFSLEDKPEGMIWTIKKK